MRPGDAARSDGAGLVLRPELFERLGAARVTMVSAPAGSGKTVLLRSWIAATELTDRAAWVPVRRDERDPQRFWRSVCAALRRTSAGSELVRAVSAAPEPDGWALAERLLADLAPLRQRLWLVIDDVHELGSAEAQRQLELLVMRAPTNLRFVLATRHDLRLGLHRLRVEGGLDEIRPADLRFTLAQTRELLELAQVRLPEPALSALYERTEGWAAGLRLAALSLAGHPDPARFAAEFSGSERTVAEYLLAEVLEHQSEPVRRLLLRTSILERVNGELADLLTGCRGGERVLQDLEQANAFVTSLDGARSWFRYHQMFADLLQLKLRRVAPDEVVGLHRAAAGWLAEQGFPMEAIRHAQAAQDWGAAARLFADRWPSLLMDGQKTVIRELIGGFPAEVVAADPELAMLAAACQLPGAPAHAEGRYLVLAERAAASAPPERQAHAQLILAIIRLLLARHQWDLPAALEAARQLQVVAKAPDAALPGLDADLRAMALVSLGTTEFSIARFDDATRHLEQGTALAHRIGRPYLEFLGRAYQSMTQMFDSLPLAIESGRAALELARMHGWTDDPTAGIAYAALGAVAVWQGRLADAERWLQRAERTLYSEVQPPVGMAIRIFQAILHLAHGRCTEAVAAFEAAEHVIAQLPQPHPRATVVQAFKVLTYLRMGRLDAAAATYAAVDAQERASGGMRLVLAAIQLAEGEPLAARVTLAPVLDGSVPVRWARRLAQGFLLEAIAQDALGNLEAAEAAVERALDAAEPDGELLWFLLHPVPDLLERRARHRTGHPALVAEIQSMLTGHDPRPAEPEPQETLSDSEIRILRYLPTHLSAPEIARELSVSPNTVKTHLRNLYTKLGVHRRSEAVGHARALGLLAPATRRR
ncbi:LuxR C-terminal-related transcriptional regulator [Nocardia terpenica]|uniref:LuxR C-terminal-related transcriptional regulator n=1 Tax=Nocardia terpenica TaxID=455432 RepID=UPI00142D4BA2|nr:LuxR C-terminal-related transcriptional regulator [Nocardia terpenica]